MGQIKILVVDNDVEVAVTITRLLVRMGYSAFDLPKDEAMMAFDKAVECDVILIGGHGKKRFYEALGKKPRGQELQQKVIFKTGGFGDELEDTGRPLLRGAVRTDEIKRVIDQLGAKKQ